MSEKIFSWLLRLYPTHFRKAYGEEALLLLRDRARDEQGFLLRSRLWLDLLTDLAVSIPREYRNHPQAILRTSARPCWNGNPSFQMLEGEAPTLSSLLFGGALSLAIYASVLFLIGHARSHFPLPDANTRERPSYALSPKPASPAEKSTQRSGDDQAASRESNSPSSGQDLATAAKRQFKEFDFASIRESMITDTTSMESKTGDPSSMNDSLRDSDIYAANGGYFHMTNVTLLGYIAFAYRMNGYQSAVRRGRCRTG
jgi:hypothetical protein